MNLKGTFLTGIIAILVIGVPSIYAYTVLYPQYATNTLYVVVGGVIFVLFTAWAARFAIRKGGG